MDGSGATELGQARSTERPEPPAGDEGADPPGAPPQWFTEVERRLERRIDAMVEAKSHRAVPGRNGAGPAPAVSSLSGVQPEASRVDELERQLHEGLTRVHRAVASFRTRLGGNYDDEAARAEFDAALADRLTRLQAELASVHEQRLAQVQADLGDRVDRIERAVRSMVVEIETLRAEVGHLAAVVAETAGGLEQRA